MYELFILGELMDKPLHGYLLQKILSNVFGPVRKISWGVLYPLIRQLEKKGFIEKMEGDQSSSGRPRKAYRITDEGVERFHWLMTEPAEYTMDYEDLFDIKLSNFHHIEAEEQVHILKQYEDYLRFLDHHTATLKEEIAENECILDSERPDIFRVMDHRRGRLKADLEWVEQETKKILGGGLENE